MILATICKLILAMAVGYYLNKKGIFHGEINQKLSYFVINICLPLMIITSLKQVDDSMSKGLLMRYILVGAAFYAVLPFIGKLMCVLTKTKKEDRAAYELMYIFPNNMFMGYPVSASIFGAGCIFQLSTFNLAFNLLYFTYGIGRIRKEKGAEGEKISLKSIFSPGTVASVVALVMFFAEIQLPEPFVEVCTFLGDLASPLSMVVIGSTIGTYSIKSVMSYDFRIYILSAVRLLIYPVVTYLLMTVLGFDGILRGVAVISMGMPTASMVSMGCIEQKYQEELASAGVILSTVLSLPVIPVLLMLLS